MKQQLNEEFRRMQKLAGLVTEDEKYIVGKPHSNSIYPAGGAWHNLSTGKSIDLGEDPNHPGYEKLTPKEHKEVIKLLTNYITKYKENFFGTKLYKKSVVKGAEELIEKHKEKLAGLVTEGEHAKTLLKENLDYTFEELKGKVVILSLIEDGDTNKEFTEINTPEDYKQLEDTVREYEKMGILNDYYPV